MVHCWFGIISIEKIADSARREPVSAYCQDNSRKARCPGTPEPADRKSVGGGGVEDMSLVERADSGRE